MRIGCYRKRLLLRLVKVALLWMILSSHVPLSCFPSALLLLGSALILGFHDRCLDAIQ